MSMDAVYIAWGPPADPPWHRVLWTGPTGDPHGEVFHPGLRSIAVADVLDTLEELVERAA